MLYKILLIWHMTDWKCDLCHKEEVINKEKIVGQKRAADQMFVTSHQKLKLICVSQTIAIEVSKVDPKNILGTILDIKNVVYRIGTNYGIINRWFSRDEIIANNCQLGINFTIGKRKKEYGLLIISKTTLINSL